MRCKLFIAAMVLGLQAAAQFSVEPGTTLLVDPGTSLRLESSGAFAIPSGSTVINNGEVVLGSSTDLQEAAGAAISGTGVERTTRDLGAVTQADIGGLGAKLTTAASLGLTQITRGHLPFTDYSGSTSIARWVQVDPANNTGLNAGLEFRYDLNELNAVPESDQVVHIRHQPDVWWALPSAVNVADRWVVTSGLDSLGLFSTFAGQLPNVVAEAPGNDLRFAVDDAGDAWLYVPGRMPVRQIELFSAGGGLIASQQVNWHGGWCAVPLRPRIAGMHILRVNGERNFKWMRP